MLALRSAAAIVSSAALTAFGTTPLNQPTSLARASTPTFQGETLPSPSATCPITPPPSEPFVPPTPYPTKLLAGSFWLGSEKLWTMRYTDGLWRGYWVTDPDSKGYRVWLQAPGAEVKKGELLEAFGKLHARQSSR